MTTTDVSTVEGVTRRISGFGLGPPDRFPIEIDDGLWSSSAWLLSAHRLTGIALAAVEGGGLHLSGSAFDDLVERHRDQMLHSLALERVLLGVGLAMRANGVEFIVLKGPALAHTIYPDPAWRPFGDLDLLVRTTDWRAACGILANAGFIRNLPEPRPGFDERFGKAATHTNAGGLQIDLHRTLTLGPFGLWLEPERLFGETAVFDLGGVGFRRLNDTALLLHACMHASLGAAPALPVPLRDVAQLSVQGRIEWSTLHEQGIEWRLIPVFRDAMVSASDRFGIELSAPARVLIESPSSRRERRALRGYQFERRPLGGVALATAMGIPGVRRKAGYVRGLLFPTREFLQARTGRRGSYFARWRIPLRWMATRARGVAHR